MTQILLRYFRLLLVSRNQRATLARLAAIAAGLIVVSSLGFWLCEADADPQRPVGWGDAVWWSVVTMTTVGYGDLFPVTWAGRWLVALPTMVLGIGAIGYAIGLVTTIIVERAGQGRRGMRSYSRENHVILCHCPSVETVLEVFDETHADRRWAGTPLVLVSEQWEELPDALRERGVFFVRGSASREAVLERAGIERARAVMVFASDRRDAASDNESLGALVTIRTLAPDVPVVVECVAAEHIKLLERAGATEVVGTGTLGADLMVQGMQDPGINGVIAELLSNTTGHQFYIEPVRRFRGTWRELREAIGARGSSVVVLGLIVDGERRFLPPDDTVVEAGQSVILIGRNHPGSL